MLALELSLLLLNIPDSANGRNHLFFELADAFVELHDNEFFLGDFKISVFELLLEVVSVLLVELEIAGSSTLQTLDLPLLQLQPLLFLRHDLSLRF